MVEGEDEGVEEGSRGAGDLTAGTGEAAEIRGGGHADGAGLIIND